MHNVIIAPHPDDEIIGCYHVLNTCLNSGTKLYVCYGIDPDHDPSCRKAAKAFQFTPLDGESPDGLTCIREAARVYAPDPYFETHPQHRRWGHLAESRLRTGNKGVVFYSVNMQAPYIFEVDNPEDKLRALDECYPEKSELWQFDHRYFLFEGYCSWLRPTNV